MTGCWLNWPLWILLAYVIGYQVGRYLEPIISKTWPISSHSDWFIKCLTFLMISVLAYLPARIIFAKLLRYKRNNLADFQLIQR
jgi:hypothetical protein